MMTTLPLACMTMRVLGVEPCMPMRNRPFHQLSTPGILGALPSIHSHSPPPPHHVTPKVVVLIGTLFKDMPLRPSVLDEYRGDAMIQGT